MMKTNLTPMMTAVRRKKLGGLMVGGFALVFVAAGAFTTFHATHAAETPDDTNRIFELEIYHAVPGKAAALVARFSDASKLQAKHGLHVLGYWVPDDQSNTFIYLLAHRNRDEAKKNWTAFHADPEFQKYVQAEKAEALIDSVDTIYMRPTDFSSMK